jgi:hypothetical protein
MSYVVLTIDTTNPTVTIYAPSYTTQDVVNTITVEADEPIADYQDIYIVDSQSVRHDYVFAKEDENTYVGRVRFNDLPLGVHTMYARVKDDVDNYSNVAMKVFEVKESLYKGNVTVNHREMADVNISDLRTISTDVSDSKMANVKINDRAVQ